MTNQTLTLDAVIAANIAALIEHRKLSRPDVGRRLVALGIKGWNERSAWVRLASGKRQLRVTELFAFAQLLRVKVEDLAIPELVSRLDLRNWKDEPVAPRVSVQPFTTMLALDYEQYLTDFLWVAYAHPVATQNRFRGVGFRSDGSPYWSTQAERAEIVRQLNETIAEAAVASHLGDDGVEAWREGVAFAMQLDLDDPADPDIVSAIKKTLAEQFAQFLDTYPPNSPSEDAK